MRVIAKGWTTMEACETTLTRIRVIEMNEWLDAQEEAELLRAEKEKLKQRRR